MPSRSRLIAAAVALIVAGLLIFLFTPLLVGTGLRVWISWQARIHKLIVTVDKIEAPLFHPVVLHGIHIRTRENVAVQFEATATQATVALNLQGILLRARGRAIHHLAVTDLHVETRRNPNGVARLESGW